MQITQASLQALQTSFSSVFRGAYKDAPRFWSEFAMRVPSSTATNTYGWMHRLLKMRKWDGPRVVQNLKTHAYVLENDTYEATLGVRREEIEDDQLGLFGPRVQELARVAARLPDDLVLEALRAGNSTGIGFDGLAQFAEGHILSPNGTQNNTGAETLSQANWTAIRAEMRSYQGEDGKPLGVNPDLVVIPPQFETVAKQIFEAEYVPFAAGTTTTSGGGGNSNMTKGEARILVIEEMTPADGWFVFDTTGPMQCLIFQDRKPVQMVAKTNMSDDNVFHLNEFLWGLDGRGAAGYGPWWLGYHATGTSASF